MADGIEIKEFTSTSINDDSKQQKRKVKLTNLTLSALKKGLQKLNDRRKVKYTQAYENVVSESELGTDSKDFDYAFEKLKKLGVKMKRVDFGIHRIECVQASKPVNINERFLTRIKRKFIAFLNAGSAYDVKLDMRNAYDISKDKIMGDEKNLGLEKIRNYSSLYDSFQNPVYPKPVDEEQVQAKDDNQKLVNNPTTQLEQQRPLNSELKQKSDSTPKITPDNIANLISNISFQSSKESEISKVEKPSANDVPITPVTAEPVIHTSRYADEMKKSLEDVFSSQSKPEEKVVPNHQDVKPVVSSSSIDFDSLFNKSKDNNNLTMQREPFENKVETPIMKVNDSISNYNSKIDSLNSDVNKFENMISEYTKKINSLKAEMEGFKEELEKALKEKNKLVEEERKQAREREIRKKIEEMLDSGFSHDTIVNEFNPTTDEEKMKLRYTIGLVEGQRINASYTNSKLR